MKTKTVMFAALACSLLLLSVLALAANQATERQQVQVQEQERLQAQEQEHIYGSQMMTEQERYEYRARMQAAKTDQEREQIRMEHHERMTERAKARGLTLPATPPRKGGGMGGKKVK